MVEWPNGIKFEGSFKKGRTYGKGILSCVDGTKYHDFENKKGGKIDCSEVSYNKGRMTLPDGTQFLGTIENGVVVGFAEKIYL